MRKTVMVLSWLLAACTSAGPTSRSSALSASADARRIGVYAYTVEGDRVWLFDKDGVELGQLAISVPADDRRVVSAAMTDGTTDELEVYQPLPDGRFNAPVTPETALTAAAADPALAKLWAAYRVRFLVIDERRLAPNDRLEPSIVANLNPCDGVNLDTPAGCARLANPAVGCTNPTALPATMTDNSATWQTGDFEGLTLSDCMNNKASTCQIVFGGTEADWSYGNYASKCTGIGNNLYRTDCRVGNTANQWIASCPRVSCGIVGQYDAVPRNKACVSPGSCTKTTGTIGCTPYH